jgi:hypothetical protein
MLIAGPLCAIGIMSYLRRRPVPLALFLLPGMALAAAAIVSGLVLRPRFFFLLIGFLMLLIARGLICAAEWSVQRTRVHWTANDAAVMAWSLVLALVALAIPALLFNYRMPKQDFDSARTYIATHRVASEPVVTAGTASYPFRRYYAESWDEVVTRDEFERFGRLHRRFWIVYSQPEYLERSLRTAIEARCTSPRIFPGTLDGGDVVVCDATVGPRTELRSGGLP